MGKKKENRKKQEKDRNRQEVISCAIDLFYKKGYQGVTVPEIAAAVEFGVGTLYRLFPGGKEEIYHAMMEIVVRAFEKEIENNMAGAEDETDMIRRYIRAAAAVYEAYPRQMGMYVRNTAGVGLDLGFGLTKELASRYRACSAHVEQALIKGQERGEFTALPPGMSMMCLRTAINGFFMNSLENEEKKTIGETVGLIETFFFNGILKKN
jgi:AcrR family transcriptional regulator